MGRTIKLVDFQSAQLMGDNREANLRLLDAASDVSGLRVSIRATHSGSLVNGRVYKGIHMKDAVNTWTTPYERPILTHHADGGGMFGGTAVDPKGRVTKAEFSQLRKGPAFDNDFKRPAPGGMGSGHITVEALITDEDAMAKILDGRYLTVSSSQTTDSMVCSICETDWFENYCEHDAGKAYAIETGKGKKKVTREYLCYGIAGPLVYRELSFVNVPAQPNAKVLGVLEETEAKDGLNMMTWSNHNAITGMALCDAEGNVLTDLTDSRNLVMAEETKKVYVEMPGTEDADLENTVDATSSDAETTLDNPVTPEKLVDPSEPANDEGSESNSDVAVMSANDFALATVVKSIKDNGLWLNKDEQIPVFDGATEDSEGESPHSHLIICQKTEEGKIIGRTYATIGDVTEHSHVIDGDFYDSEKAVGLTRDADSGFNHTHDFGVVELPVEFDDESLDKLVADLEEATENEEDPRLSADQRVALKSKDYCGPNHSFPVTDTEHVSAALQLLPYYKSDAATKERIARSIERKASKLGVVRQTKKPVEPQSPADTEGNAEVTHRDEALEEAILDLTVERAKSKSLETSLTEKSQEISALEDDLAKEKAARSAALANTLTIFRMVLAKSDCVGVDNPAKFAEKVVSYSSRTPESLWDAVSDLLPEVDLVIRNLRKAKERVLPYADGETKGPLKHIAKTKKNSSKNPSGRVTGVDKLTEDLDS